LNLGVLLPGGHLSWYLHFKTVMYPYFGHLIMNLFVCYLTTLCQLD